MILTSQKVTLTGRLISANELNRQIKNRMFELMSMHFHSIKKNSFNQDLKNKNSIILLEDDQKIIQGFTTIKHFKTIFENQPIMVIFSGDTIIHQDYWGTLELPRAWGKFMLSALHDAQGMPLYWFLISSGYKTYRFLPVFFKEFFPRYDAKTPDNMNRLIEHLANFLFPAEFNKEQGTIVLKNPSPLRPGVADLNPERLTDPHVAFFAQMNPDHEKGIELACIALLDIENLQPFVKRLLRSSNVSK